MSAPDRLSSLAWEKMSGLIPAIVQDAFDGRVLMMAYMNEEALAKTQETGWATFFSRSRQGLWTKGETSGNRMKVRTVHADCDGDTLLVLVEPKGPACHLGDDTCFDERMRIAPDLAFLNRLESVIDQRRASENADSYVAKLFDQGTARIAQKVGEEGVESALAGVQNNTEELKNEAADLIFHLMVLLRDQGLGLSDVMEILKGRAK